MLVFAQSHTGCQFLRNTLMLPRFARGDLSKANVGWGAWQGCISAAMCDSSNSKQQEGHRRCIFLSPAACYLTGNWGCFPPAGQAALASRQAPLGYILGIMSPVQHVTCQWGMLQGTHAMSALPPHSSVPQLHGSTGSFPGPPPQEKTTTADTRCARWQLPLLPALVQAGVLSMQHPIFEKRKSPRGSNLQQKVAGVQPKRFSNTQTL